MCKPEDKKRLGIKGENKVKRAIYQTIKELGYMDRVYSNCLIQYDSIYGSMTAEMDVVFFSPKRIYIFEVKNAIFTSSGYDEKIWKLFDEEKGGTEKCSNPLLQNQYHKRVLCEALGIPLDSVTTIEVLLGNGKENRRRSPLPNDFILDEQELFTDLKYVLVSLASTRKDFNIEQAHARFLEEIKKAKEDEVYHNHRIKRAKIIQRQLKEQNARFFKFTDRVNCPFCGKGEFIFESCYSARIQNEDQTQKKPCLKCIKCGKRLDYAHRNNLKKIQELEVISISDRNKWTEEENHMNTVWDERNSWKDRFDDMEKTLLASERRNIAQALKMSEVIDENRKNEERIPELETALERSMKPSVCFARLMKFIFAEGIKICSLITRLL